MVEFFMIASLINGFVLGVMTVLLLAMQAMR
jgi:F0F1-type ATP synthase assembly protein I